MKRSNIAKSVAALFVVTLIVPMLFAAGMKETAEDAVTGRIIAIETPGMFPAFTIRTTDESTLAVRTDTKTVSSFPLSALSVGDYLDVVAVDGTASEIRFLNPVVFSGIMNLSINGKNLDRPESLTDRFSYTYGYLLLQSFANQGLFFDGGYYLKGAMDGITAVGSPDEQGFYTHDELYANIDTYQTDVWNAGLAASDFGDAYSDLDTIGALQKSDDVTKAFSYTYGYLLTYNMLSQGIDIDSIYYVNGAMDYAFGNTPLMNDDEMRAAFSEYQQKVEEEYQVWKAKAQKENLAAAEAYLAENKDNDGVVTTDSGLQYQVLTPAEGPKPQDGDTVELNYQLQTADGTVVESSYDTGSTVHFALSDVIPGFRETLKLMNAGSVVRCWVHPDLGYGEDGTSKIQPNALLIFDIELVGIDPPAGQ